MAIAPPASTPSLHSRLAALEAARPVRAPKPPLNMHDWPARKERLLLHGLTVMGVLLVVLLAPAILLVKDAAVIGGMFTSITSIIVGHYALLKGADGALPSMAPTTSTTTQTTATPDTTATTTSTFPSADAPALPPAALTPGPPVPAVPTPVPPVVPVPVGLMIHPSAARPAAA